MESDTQIHEQNSLDATRIQQKDVVTQIIPNTSETYNTKSPPTFDWHGPYTDARKWGFDTSSNPNSTIYMSR